MYKCVYGKWQMLYQLSDDFRPISILSYTSKVFEKVANSQIVWHLQAHKLLSENQSGFRQGRSCNRYGRYKTSFLLKHRYWFLLISPKLSIP